MKKNLIISITILRKDICNGPKCGFIEKRCINFKALKINEAFHVFIRVMLN